MKPNAWSRVATATLIWLQQCAGVEETNMKNVVLWALGVPISVLVIANVLGFL